MQANLSKTQDVRPILAPGNHNSLAFAENFPRSSEETTERWRESAQELLHVRTGQLTFDAEGQESGPFFSRRISKAPGQHSGVAIGRGYDMGMRSAKEIMHDLLGAGLSKTAARLLSRASGLQGRAAASFVSKYASRVPTLTLLQQKTLFESLVYPRYSRDVERLVSKRDVVEKYGKTNWEDLNPLIKEVLIDLRYRGDYTPETRRVIQQSIVANDLREFRSVLANHEYWVHERGVPEDRFKRRLQWLDRVPSP